MGVSSLVPGGEIFDEFVHDDGKSKESTGLKNRLLDDVVDHQVVNAVETVKESISNGVKDSSFNSCLLDKLEGSLVKIFKEVPKPKTECLLGVSSSLNSDTFGSNVLMDIQKPNATVNELIEVSVKDDLSDWDQRDELNERGISSNLTDNDGMENDFSGVSLVKWPKRKKSGGTKCKLKYGKWEFDLWKWPKRKKKRTFVEKGWLMGFCVSFPKEAFAPYERPTLTKRGERQTPTWYKEKGIEMLYEDQVTGIDAEKQTLTTNSLKFGSLIIATGYTASRFSEKIGMKVAAAAVGWNLDATKYEELYQVNSVKFLAGASINSLASGVDGNIAAVWLKERAATMEHGDVIKRKLWEAVVEFANEEDAKLLLQRAMECCPLQVEVWLALSRLGKYDDAKHISRYILTQLIKFLASDHVISWSNADGFATV
ncbi:hypothetical protein CTI12_AA316030 [Artemisia annua]|uniref:Uncharacterized protein n=1 Tax=Artemisia annua TaxID=35608 RepID=A0A2U1N2E3_ARTAN|nr:hypothetical protein CTI12_AA316030 [Artemisia annua]